MISPEDNAAESDGQSKADHICASFRTELTRIAFESDQTVHITAERTETFDFYSCEEAIKRLNEYLDSELDTAEREDVLKHLKVCAPCLERFHFEKTLMVKLRDKFCRSITPASLKERLSTLMKSGE
jgi:mycothiol system anti-sigma-R factor